jgi:predicted DNA-binding transcriptional regulator YafY
MFGYNNSIRYQKGGIDMDGLLLRSIEENIPLEMIYFSEDQKISHRKLLVKEVNDDYIRAYCLLRKQIRTFRRGNILSLMPNTRSSDRFLH